MADRAVLTITWTQDGQIQVNGPINDKILCYGLLEAAKDAIRDYVAKNTASNSLTIAHGTLPLNGKH